MKEKRLLGDRLTDAGVITRGFLKKKVHATRGQAFAARNLVLLAAGAALSFGGALYFAASGTSAERRNVDWPRYGHDFPRGTDLSVHSQAQLDQVALRLNQRPRKTLGFETPASKVQASVASTI
jgi:hypothetical protein